MYLSAYTITECEEKHKSHKVDDIIVRKGMFLRDLLKVARQGGSLMESGILFHVLEAATFK